MPGRAALTGIDAVRADIRSVTKRENPAGAGDPVGEYSAIGGEGRMGADGYGSLTEPSYTRIDAQLVGNAESGLATKGSMGVGYGVGRTFSGSGSYRKQD